MNRPLMEDEVFVRAYCAALTGLLTRRSLEPFDKKRVFVQEMCSAYAENAVEAWRNRSTKPTG